MPPEYFDVVFINVRRLLMPLAFSLLIVGLCSNVSGESTTFHYFYDDLNQLVKVVDSTGVVVEYVYDPVGNILKINRSTVSTGVLTIFNITPATVATGATLTIQGQGFSPTPTANTVMIGGVAAVVISATPTTLVVLVPGNAVSGVISVSVGGTTVNSSSPETILPLGIISSVTPKSALAGTAIDAFTVIGENLTDATFTFSAPGITVNDSALSPDGKSAVLSLSISAGAQGRFTLTATNPAGVSDGAPKLGFLPGSQGNTLTIPGADANGDADRDGLTNSHEIVSGTDPLNGDTDGDSWPDGLETLYRSDPLDPLSIPHPQQDGGFLSTPVISMLNHANPAGATTGTKQYTSSLVFSLLNSHNPSNGAPGSQQYVSSLVFSMLNNRNPSTSPSGSKQYISSQVFSMLNSLNPLSGAPGSKQYLSSLVFSALNGLNPSAEANGSRQYVSSLIFSILNAVSPNAALPTFKFTSSPIYSISNGTAVQGPNSRAGAFLADGTIEARTAQPWAFLITSSKQLDSDGDGVSDEDEIRLKTNPFSRDTDQDGYPDGLEVALGSNPLDANSTPDVNRAGYGVSPTISIQNYPQLAQLRRRQ